MAQPQIPNTDWRNQEIKIDPFIYQLAASAVFIIIAILIGFSFFPSNDEKSSYQINLYTTLIGFLVTGFLLDRSAKRREDRRAEAELKARLIRGFGSKSNDAAIHAAEELRDKGWLEDGSLDWNDFSGANLQGAILSQASLKQVNLVSANLCEVNFFSANLCKANLMLADLQEAQLMFANLQKANLQGTNLQLAGLESANLHQTHLQSSNLRQTNLRKAHLLQAYLMDVNLLKSDMREANLKQANLADSNLQEADLLGAQYDESTILPDGTNWISGTDMNRFTDPNHPQFWRSNEPSSFAYGGNTSG